jgi:integrase
VKGNESTGNGSNGQSAGSALQAVRTGQHRQSTYQKVRDERKRPIRGLWLRNGRYYAQITLEEPKTGVKQVRRVPLENAGTPAQAKAALEELLVRRRKGQTIVQRRAPKFAEFAEEYLEHHRQAKDIKRASTMATEGHAINRLKEQLGQFHLDKLKRAHIDHFIAQRQSAGVSARTVNLEITVLRNVLNLAIDRQLISVLPTENLRPLKSSAAKRRLIPVDAIEKLCAVPFEPRFCNGRLARPDEKGQPLLNAEQFVDYVRLMCYAGSRMSETLRLGWADVDWTKRQLIIGSDGQTKNRQSRAVDFNEKLETHLQDMRARRIPGSQWLFPSPRSGEEDRPAKTFRESLRLARQAAELPDFGFHDCRHFYISFCVMAGIDYMTIARWVGHQDGGILIGRVYGHLSDEHAKLQASKLSF